MSQRLRFRIRTKLLLLSMLLLAVPWLALSYLDEMRDFLLSGQEKAQELTAQAIATVLHERTDLFTPETLASVGKDISVYAFPLEEYIQIDGYGSDWGNLLQRSRHYGKSATEQAQNPETPQSLAFDVVLGARQNNLYAFLHVDDDQIVYRHPAYRRLDNCDQLRLTLIDADGHLQRIVLLTEGPGSMSAYAVGSRWKYALTGQPLSGILAFWQSRTDGYDIELRLPLSWLGPKRQLRLSMADVDDAKSRVVTSVISTLPTRNTLNTVILRSPKLERILHGLDHSGARIWVVDAYHRVRAQVGHWPDVAENQTRTTDVRAEASVDQALRGHPALERRPGPAGEIIMATYPIRGEGKILGAVVVEQSTRDILVLQRGALLNVSLMTLMTLGVIIAGLMLFASRMAVRIRRLSEESNAAIADNGRILHPGIDSDQHAGDEFGDLSRTISDLLQRLSRYTLFLENMPRILRHEINNPLNTISTSLQNIPEARSREDEVRYLESAQRGVARISNIVQALTDAASLEEALRSEQHTPIDLSALLSNYIQSCQLQHQQRAFVLQTEGDDFWLDANDARIEQLLDKLIENAVDFSPEDSTIEVGLVRDNQKLHLTIRNEGPHISPGIQDTLFESMVSGRELSGNRQTHLGMGLYAARLIAEHHCGSIRVENVDDPHGVIIHVRLPIA